MSEPHVTVLITTYNYGQFVGEAIDSVLSQDYPVDKIQILVVDDGSTDNTPQRVAKYGSRIEYLQKPNGGQASALNFGFAHARGEIVALLDADDLFLPSKLSRVAQTFQQDSSVGMVYHRFCEWNTETNERRTSDFPLVSGDLRNATHDLFQFCAHPTSCISFRRSSVSRLFPIPETIRMLADAYPVNLIPLLTPIWAITEPLTLYRIHGRNSYYSRDEQLALQDRQARLQMWQTLVAAMYSWLDHSALTGQRSAVRAFVDRWTLFLDGMQFAIDDMQFAIEPPGRMRFFGHFLRYNYWHRKSFGWRFRAMNYFNAFMVLAIGYKHLPSIKRAEQSFIRTFRRLTKRLTSTS